MQLYYLYKINLKKMENQIKMKKTFSQGETEFEMAVNLNVGATEHVKHEINCNAINGAYTAHESCSNATIEDTCAKMELMARMMCNDPVEILKKMDFK